MSLTQAFWGLIAKYMIDYGLTAEPDQVLQKVEQVGKNIEQYESSFFKSLYRRKQPFSLPSVINILTLILILYMSLVIVNRATRIALALFKTLATISFLLLMVCLGVYWFLNSQ
ncbi:nuclear membrane organization protein Apq12 [Schizosaccharomyces cryophilus OY26]|uniref:Nuclear membrane organization protein Apq12 n=1 Tax=Schizosaccharomyces cryophilus (strain OY26 / ATCC MYA-4695 / CBS 11777 / NBRC 106824 / NRRL Y48691) TaxID=653667 RepID=S9XBE3_SCHCR|nr:nuclear membrane organization protein Apq12 [Schizosaccharomyces cryophilus OY26]EPY51096.1 nuclear membrane organization protein Apq12 [Schizosaccharomyces cryophilus OY26]